MTLGPHAYSLFVECHVDSALPSGHIGYILILSTTDSQSAQFTQLFCSCTIACEEYGQLKIHFHEFKKKFLSMI
jgi:hypothetical protein